jgi:hypothetical protein
MIVLKIRAPWLPPKMSRCGGEPAGRGRRLKNSARTGTPVICALRKYFVASGKLTAAALTNPPTMRFAMPGYAFGS